LPTRYLLSLIPYLLSDLRKGLKRNLRSGATRSEANWSGKPGRRIAAMRPKTEKAKNTSNKKNMTVAYAKRPFRAEGGA
jgi:hypothetical protein